MHARATGLAAEPRGADRLTAPLADAVGACGETGDRGIDLGQVVARLLHERVELDRSNAMVAPSGSCSSSALLSREAATTSSKSSVRVASRCSVS